MTEWIFKAFVLSIYAALLALALYFDYRGRRDYRDSNQEDSRDD